MFRELNKPQLTKIKQQNFIGIRAFDSRLYLDISRSFKWKESFIFRYFKVFQVSQMFNFGLSDLILLAVGSLVVFVLREYILKVHILVSSENKLCQTWNTCIVSCIPYLGLYNVQDFAQILDFVGGVRIINKNNVFHSFPRPGNHMSSMFFCLLLSACKDKYFIIWKHQ
jgi:hypothetical protein